jgi:glycine/D-amino acid oxidase-like deaminating enzyme
MTNRSVVVGGGIVGLATAMVMAERGYPPIADRILGEGTNASFGRTGAPTQSVVGF